jgi:hypothetical protein
MKHGVKPTLKQRKQISDTCAIGKTKLVADNWLVYKETPTEFYIYNKKTGIPLKKPILKG